MIHSPNQKYMKALIVLLLALPFGLLAQERKNPVIPSYGSIFDIPYATVKPDPSLDYNIVIELLTPEESPSVVNTALDNVARLMNLHVVGGVRFEKLHVVVALHKEAIFTLMDNDAYKNKFKTDNPNLGLLKELQDAGVKIVACGQSLLKRNVDYKKLAPGVEVATSMLTTVTMYQLKGYAMLKF